MTYSSALFGVADDGTPRAGDDRWPRPSGARSTRLLDRAGVGPGCRLLEIGTGWGELAMRAARRGASVLTVTISAEQQALAAQRVAEAGLADRVRVELRDYRDVEGTFDAICSCEMIEAVGERYWDAYFAALDRPGWPPAAGSGCRRSPCRTTGCWPPAAPTPGSRSTSSPAA